MKRKILLLLTIVITLSFTGCSSQNLEQENKELKQTVEKLQKELDEVTTSYNELLAESSNDDEDTSSSKDYVKPDDVFTIGETLTLDGICTFTFTAVEKTDERNSTTDLNPEQVIRLTFDYENIGYTAQADGLFIGSTSFQVIDANGEMASTYPLTSNAYPKATPVGAKCVGAQEVYALNNASTNIKVVVSVRDNNSVKHSVTFELPIQ